MFPSLHFLPLAALLTTNVLGTPFPTMHIRQDSPSGGGNNKDNVGDIKDNLDVIKDTFDSVKEQEERLYRGLCGGNDNSVTFKTIQAAQDHMNHGRYVSEIDDFISKLSKEDMANGGTTLAEQPWPEQYAIEHGWTTTNTARDEKFGSCRSMTDTCRLFEAEADGTYTCSWFYNSTDVYNGQVGYWVFRLIEGVNHKINLFSKHIVEETLNTHLKLAKLNEDFDPPEEEEDPAWKWFKFAFGLVTSFLPLPPGFPEDAAGNLTQAIEYATLFFDTIESVSNEVKEAQERDRPQPITSADLGVALSDIFTSIRNALRNNLETALGKSERVGDWDQLSSYGEGAERLKTPVGKFLNNPLWLVENDASILEATMAATAANVQHRLITMKLRSENWHLTLDTRSTEKCDGKGARTINYAGGDKCFRLYKIPSYELKPENRPEPADDAFYEKLDDYGLGPSGLGDDDGLARYYEAILDCYRQKGKDGELDTEEAVTPGGEVPACFFNLRVAKLGNGRGCSGGAHGNFGNPGNCIGWSFKDLET